MSKLKLGVALCGSYCTYEEVFAEIERLCSEYDVTPIMSENSSVTDSRFGTAKGFAQRIEELSGKKPICSIAAAEPIGPKKLLDVLLVMPCTVNTLSKIAAGITDTAVTMAVKAHLRNEKPVVLAIATNDGLAGNAANIGALLNRRNIYFVPFRQDDPTKKPRSIIADFSLAEAAVEMAAEGEQIPPIIMCPAK